MMARQQNAGRQSITGADGPLDFMCREIHGSLSQNCILFIRGDDAIRKMQHHRSAHSEVSDSQCAFLRFLWCKYVRVIYLEKLRGFPFVQEKNVEVRKAGCQ